MQRYAIVANNVVVVDVLSADAEFIEEWVPSDEGQIAILLDSESPVGVGWGYDGTDFIEPPPIEWFGSPWDSGLNPTK